MKRFEIQKTGHYLLYLPLTYFSHLPWPFPFTPNCSLSTSSNTNYEKQFLFLFEINNFRYLVSLISSDIKCKKDNPWIAQVKDEKSMISKTYSKETLYRKLVWNVVIYNSESWTLLTMGKVRIKVFQMWYWYWNLRILLTSRMINNEVLSKRKITVY